MFYIKDLQYKMYNSMSTIHRLRIFTDFCSSTEAMTSAKRVWGEPLSGWELVDDESYTHAILMNTPMVLHNIPKENVLGLAMEPFIGFLDKPHPFLNLTPEFIQYANQYIGNYFLSSPFFESTTKKMPEPFKARFSFLWHMPVLPKDYIPATIQSGKPLFSMMVSHKRFAPGHEYRHKLITTLLRIPNFPIHIYGNGCEDYSHDRRVRGVFDDDITLYQEYPFNICIENFQLPHYFSEKLINPLLCATTPVYLGCIQIDEYFPKHGDFHGIMKLTGTVDTDLRLLYKIIKNPEEYRKKHTPCREKVRETTSLMRNLDILFPQS